jgi:hypothetical protein
VEGRAQFITLNLHRSIIGILNVYAPNNTGTRARFWNSLAEFAYPEADWIVARDFNMTELSEDQSQDYNARNMGHMEEAAWARLTLRLGIQDVFHSNEYRRIGSKQHTWRREKPQPTWSRIDCFYTSTDLRIKGGHHRIWPTMAHVSNHTPIFLQIPFQKQKRPKHIAFNKALTHDNDTTLRFERAWELAMNHDAEVSKGVRVSTALENILRVSESLSKERKREAKEIYISQFREVDNAESSL